MSATSTLNGRPQRKQLADQLDRLDGIIDALAEGLNAAVAEACREGTRLAVKDAVVELLTNPELRALFTQSAPAPIPAAPLKPKGPGLWSRIKAKVAAARAAAANAVAGVVERAKEALIRRFVIAGDAGVALGRATG